MHRCRFLLAAAPALLVLLVAGHVGPVPAAHAFSLPVHREILHRSLDGKVSDDAMQDIAGYFAGVVGEGNQGQDILSGQYHSEFHFDSARNPSRPPGRSS